MGKTTNIAWCTSSFSPWIGCTEVSPGCDACYARVLDARHRFGGATHWGAGVPRYRTKSWHQPLAWNKKAAATGERWTVFPSLCDPFDNEVPEEWRGDFWRLIADTPNLTWLLLTKRVGNVHKGGGYYFPNVWIGASVVNQEEADRDIPKLLAVPAAKRFVSYEPALAAVNFAPWLGVQPALGVTRDNQLYMTYTKAHFEQGGVRKEWGSAIDWIIIGGESSQGKHKARQFDVAWARSTVAQCKAAGVPVFVKQLGSNPYYFGDGFKDRAGADPSEWAEDLRVQEFPK